jgi:uncharacterized coiled-coil protein SlyX
MINQGFTETQEHIDHRIGQVEGRLAGMNGVLKDVVKELHATHEDVRYLQRSMDMLVRQDAALKTLTARVTRLEKKVALTH